MGNLLTCAKDFNGLLEQVIMWNEPDLTDQRYSSVKYKKCYTGWEKLLKIFTL